MPRISKTPEERRQELIDAAMELFWTQGYEKTIVSDIVKRVGVAQGLFYYYFESKQDIFMATIDQFVQVHVEELAALLRDSTLSPIERMHNVVRELGGFLRKVDAVGPRPISGMSYEMQVKIHQHVMELMEPFLTQVLTEGDAQGVLSAPHPAHIARFILSGFVGVESWPGAPQADEMLELILQLVERLLCLPPRTLEFATEGGI
jgi:AcrR family transcriptional regulator